MTERNVLDAGPGGSAVGRVVNKVGSVLPGLGIQKLHDRGTNGPAAQRWRLRFTQLAIRVPDQGVLNTAIAECRPHSLCVVYMTLLRLLSRRFDGDAVTTKVLGAIEGAVGACEESFDGIRFGACLCNTETRGDVERVPVFGNRHLFQLAA